jgi:hypothetical protein
VSRGVVWWSLMLSVGCESCLGWVEFEMGSLGRLVRKCCGSKV